MMTELMRRIRVMTEQEGMRRGRPILVAVRVPDSVEYARAVGIDLKRWLADGFVDLLVTGGYYRLNDTSYSVALGREHGVKVYPSLDESRVRDPEARKLRSSTQAYRGRALEAWSAGADGVYLFNAFDPKDPIWRELGSAEMLATADQDYFASMLGQGAAAGGAYPHAGFMRIPRLNPATPIALRPGVTETVTFQAGALGKSASGKTASVTLRLQFNPPPATDSVAVRVNGDAANGASATGAWLEFALAPERLRQGTNEVSVTLKAGGAGIAWSDLHCTVRFGTQSIEQEATKR
jgi:hypothetical protein